ncbi:hypothetical protein HFN_2102 [Helicobacter fennelliae MRY12-0050]|uniref:Uncharacterized protein n=1 Tax=Helicobacter fennelliae MRY12-0050 TaxID=1325130 RepID=T1CXM5_9HELI|nr:hypothetical protein HFN_2102 [Helicobacter fennelliae MRY12-0050]
MKLMRLIYSMSEPFRFSFWIFVESHILVGFGYFEVNAKYIIQ